MNSKITGLKTCYKTVCIALLCCCALGFAGCSKDVVAPPKAVAPLPTRPPDSQTDDKAWKQSEFILSTLFALPGSGNPTDYRTILTRTKAAGLNRVELTFLTSSEVLEIALNVAEEVGVKTIAQDVNIFSGIGENGPQIDKQKIVKKVNELKRFKLLDGYYVWDEPFEADFDKIVSINNILKEADPSRLTYSVIFPSYGVYNWETGAYNWDDNSYTRYVNGYLDKVNPDIVSFDYYPYRANLANVDIIQNDIWKDFGYIRKQVLQRNKSLWCYIQAINLIPSQPSIINVERIRAQMYAALAYGVKGISYFNSYGSLLNDVFEKTVMYDDLTQVNKEVKNIGNVLLNKKSEKLYHTGSAITEQLRNAYFLDKLSDSEIIKSAPNDLIIGIFPGKDVNDKYVLISNKSHTATVNGEVALKTSRKIIAYNKSTDTENTIEELTNKFQLNLLPGEGKLYRLE